MPPLTATSNHRRALGRAVAATLALALGGLLHAGCEGDDGRPGPPGPPARTPSTTALDRSADLPGIVLAVTGVAPGTGPNGNLQAGDAVAVTFTLTRGDGTLLPLGDLDGGAILLAGPSFNYQLVLPRRSDLASRAVENADGSYTYVFADPLPAVYPPPLNDSPAFGAGDGELQGQALLGGTYTVGIEAYKDYTVLGEPCRDAGATTHDVLFGAATVLEPRQVVAEANCSQCHQRLEAHGGIRVDVRTCVLCHTSGAEDRNTPSAAAGTPGVSIDFRVLIHRLHNGGHLPSVLGVTTRPDGTRDRTVPPEPYEVVGFGDEVHDLSYATFPPFPNLNTPMPRDEGYAALPAAERAQEDAIRRGAATCAKCHGDPDGAGPLLAPAQGSVAFAQPSRRACGACHDDVVWTYPYRENGQTMPAQVDDAQCASCHYPDAAQALAAPPVAGVVDLAALAVEDAHRHPLLDPAFNPGVHLTIVDVTEAGTNDGDGTLDAGEKVAVTFTLTADDGSTLAPADVDRVSLYLAGPVVNPQLLLERTTLPSGALTGMSSPYTVRLPRDVLLERVGTASGGAETFSTLLDEHWHSRGAATTVLEVTGVAGAATVTSASAVALQNFVDVASAAGVVKNDYLRLGGGAEYARVALVEGTRLWLTAPLRVALAVGVAVDEVTVATRVAGTDYTLAEPSGQVSLIAGRFTAGNDVLVSYTADYRLPAVYPPPLNDSPDLGEDQGEWRGKPLVPGTYHVAGWARRPLVFLGGDVANPTEATNYSSTSTASLFDVLLLDAAPQEDTTPVIASAASCYACHDDLLFHGGGRRGYDACVVCHGTAGAEDWPRYRGGTGPATPGTTISFRDMLHRIHRGHELAQAGTYVVAGFNGNPASYGEVVFPVLPGGTQQCAVCHGSDTWREPRPRDHPDPTQQAGPALVWRDVCNSCHDSSAAGAHMDLMTVTPGQPQASEACAVCHGEGANENVLLVHKAR